MMLIPIGQSQGVWERPYVTLAMIGVCTLLHVARVTTAPGDVAYDPLQQRFENAVFQLMEEEEMGPEEAAGHAQEALEAMLNDTYDGPETGPYRTLREVADEIEEIQAQDFGSAWAYTPSEGVNLSIITYAFIHGDLFHLIFNMLFLWLAGSSLEDRWGRRFFSVFYVMGAVMAAVAFALVQPDGDTGGMVGASGAIAACMGGFLVLFYRAKINMFYMFWWFRMGTFQAPAYLALPLWFGIEALSSVGEAQGIGDGVAHSAHAGGFAFGAVVALVLKQTGWDQKLISEERRLEEAQDKADPKLEEATNLEAEGNLEGALIAYRSVLSANPNEPRAQRGVLEVAFKLKRGDLIQQYVDLALMRAAQLGDGPRVVDLYRSASEAHSDTAISERGLSLVVRFAVQGRDLVTAVESANSLIKRAPRSTYLPATLWQLAELMLALGHRDKAVGALKSLSTKYAMDPFGQKAAAKLHELRAG